MTSSDWVSLVGHAAWPAFALLVLWSLRATVVGLGRALHQRISDPRTDFSVGREGMEIRSRVGRNEDSLESIRVDLGQLKSLLAPHLTVTGSDQAKIDDDLLAMAERYREINASDWNERVRLKEEALRDMTACIIQNGVSRDALTESNDEALLAALANTIHLYPEPGDAARLLEIAARVSRLHPKYRIAMAIGRLVEERVLPRTQVDRFRQVLQSYEKGADESLQQRVTRTLKLLDEYQKRGNGG